MADWVPERQQATDALGNLNFKAPALSSMNPDWLPVTRLAQQDQLQRRKINPGADLFHRRQVVSQVAWKAVLRIRLDEGPDPMCTI